MIEDYIKSLKNKKFQTESNNQKENAKAERFPFSHHPETKTYSHPPVDNYLKESPRWNFQTLEDEDTIPTKDNNHNTSFSNANTIKSNTSSQLAVDVYKTPDHKNDSGLDLSSAEKSRNYDGCMKLDDMYRKKNLPQTSQAEG